MKVTLRSILSVTVLCLYGLAFVGCSKEAPKTDAQAPFAMAPDEDDEHDHDEHDHAAHGPRGGIIVKLSNDKETEVHYDEEADLFSVYIDGLGDVSKVQMKTTISDKETVYEFERIDTPGGSLYGLSSPELGTAVKMGQDAVKTQLVITTADGDLTAQYEHHSH